MKLSYIRHAPHGGFLLFACTGYLVSETLYGTILGMAVWGLSNCIALAIEKMKENK
jgi:hypothetical protein